MRCALERGFRKRSISSGVHAIGGLLASSAANSATAAALDWRSAAKSFSSFFASYSARGTTFRSLVFGVGVGLGERTSPLTLLGLLLLCSSSLFSFSELMGAE